jgi:hypothetical protein
VQRLVHARERGIPGDTDDGAEADDPLIGASVEPVRWTPTPLTPEEVDAIRTAYAGGVSTVELGRQYGVHRTTVWRKVMDATGTTGGPRQGSEDDRSAGHGQDGEPVADHRNGKL